MAPTDEFLNTYEEVHVLWYGLLEAFNLFAPQCIPTGARDDLWEELHYFWLGLAIGAILQCLLISGLVSSLALIIGADLVWSFLAGLAGCLITAILWICIFGPVKRRFIVGVWAYEHIDLSEFEEQYGPYTRRLSDAVDDIYFQQIRDYKRAQAEEGPDAVARPKT